MSKCFLEAVSYDFHIVALIYTIDFLLLPTKNRILMNMADMY